MPARDELDPRRGRDGRPWRELLDELCPPGTLCAMPDCDKPTRLIWFGLRHGHPMGRSLHHIVSPLDGGHPTDPGNLIPAHLGCNASAGRPPTGRPEPAPRKSRDFPPIDPRWL